MKTLSDTLLELFPLPPGLEVKPDGIPEPRVSIIDAEPASLPPAAGCFKGYHTATIFSNTRTTAPDWYQDVRHLDLDFDEDIEYVAWFIHLRALIHSSQLLARRHRGYRARCGRGRRRCLFAMRRLVRRSRQALRRQARPARPVAPSPSSANFNLAKPLHALSGHQRGAPAVVLRASEILHFRRTRAGEARRVPVA